MTSFDDLDQKIKHFEKTHLAEPEPMATPVEIKNPAFQLAIELAVALALGVVLGVAADKYFNTRPLFILIGIALGITAGAYNFYRILKGAGMAGLPFRGMPARLQSGDNSAKGTANETDPSP